MALRRLSDLKRIGHVGDARHARQIAVGFGEIGGLAIGEVFLLLCQSPGLIGDLIALYDAQSRRDSQLPDMILNVPGSGVHRLPDAVQIRLSVGQFTRGGESGLGGHRQLERAAVIGATHDDDSDRRELVSCSLSSYASTSEAIDHGELENTRSGVLLHHRKRSKTTDGCCWVSDSRSDSAICCRKKARLACTAAWLIPEPE